MAKNLRDYATKAPTETMVAFADWLIAEVYGGELPKGVSEEAFRKGVALGGSTRMDFQKSDFWKNDPRNYLARVESGRAEKIRAASEKAAETSRKAAERAAKLAAEVAALDVEDEPAEDVESEESNAA